MIAIIDYELSNINSIFNAVLKITDKVKVVKNGENLSSFDKFILPGVGSFPIAVENLKKKKLFDTLKKEVVNNKKPILGICLGMQLLFESSTEEKLSQGLGLVKGKVRPLTSEENFKVPNMGWKKIEFNKRSKLLKDIDEDLIFYFVHKYACYTDENLISSKFIHSSNFDCLIEKDNILGTQFHPEKSQVVGFKLLKNFIEKV
tara:strand:- start:139 stop:747 length:609 start_codon:yes stop_codon:yes gene_type:complete